MEQYVPAEVTMDQLTWRRHRPPRGREPPKVAGLSELAGGQLFPGDPVTNGPRGVTLIKESGPRDSGQRGMETLADGYYLGPPAAGMLPGHVLGRAPAVGADRAVGGKPRPRHPESFAFDLGEHLGQPFQLGNLQVRWLEDEVGCPPRGALATRQGRQWHACYAERGEHGLRWRLMRHLDMPITRQPQEDRMPGQVPYVSYLRLGDDPHLVANACGGCGALFFDRRNACASCGGSAFNERRLASNGVLRAFTIVHRASPGVTVPYVSGIVDLDGGGVVKANVVGIDPEPDQVALGMKVKLATFPVGTDSAGTQAVGFGYEPA